MLCFSTLSGERQELRLLLVRLCDVRAIISDSPSTRGAETTSQLRPNMRRLSVYYQLLLRGYNGDTSIYATAHQLPTTTRRPVYENSRTVIMFQPRGVEFTSVHSYKLWCSIRCINSPTNVHYYKHSLLQLCTLLTGKQCHASTVVPIRDDVEQLLFS